MTLFRQDPNARASSSQPPYACDECVTQLVDSSPAIPRLGIHAYEWRSEGLHGKYGASFVRGVQGDSFEGESTLGDNLQASACRKHDTAHDLDKWNGVNSCAHIRSRLRHSDKSGASTGTSRGIPMPSTSIMLSKNTLKTPEDAAADALRSGMDVECSTSARSKDFPSPSFSMRMRLGLFNGDPTKQLYGNIAPDQVRSQEHQALALEAALDGIVLLKNSDRLLPLSKSGISSLVVVGPNAHNSTYLLGNYFGTACKNVTILEVLRKHISSASYNKGCNKVLCTPAAVKTSAEMAQTGD
ncbi:unnamed protein product [Dovyalis caffra]|uniref:Glycoside hydrolase family 3 C-terminal domain-containing protein n=1 Tax=Dovyalis caffra TaxID=77055 RepID=A0AAV1S743_9ROSI|nr:unnamed protein product [Dovyalis caffra]